MSAGIGMLEYELYALIAWIFAATVASAWVYSDAYLECRSRVWTLLTVILGPLGLIPYLLVSRHGISVSGERLPDYEIRLAPPVEKRTAEHSAPKKEMDAARPFSLTGLPHCPRCGQAVSLHDARCIRCGNLLNSGAAASGGH